MLQKSEVDIESGSGSRRFRIVGALVIVAVVVICAVGVNAPKSVKQINNLKKNLNVQLPVGADAMAPSKSTVMGSYCASMCDRIRGALSDKKKKTLAKKCVKNCVGAGSPLKKNGYGCEGICNGECNGFGQLGNRDTCELTCSSFCVAMREEVMALKNDKSLNGQKKAEESHHGAKLAQNELKVIGDWPTFWSYKPYWIRNVYSQLVIDVPGQNFGYGTQMIQYHKWGVHDSLNNCAQLWEIVWKNRHVGPTAYIRNWCRKEWYLDIGGVGRHNGAPLTIWSYHGGSNQQFILNWTFQWADINMVAVHSNKVLDIAGPSKNAFARIHQWSNYGGSNQKWVLDKAGW